MRDVASRKKQHRILPVMLEILQGGLYLPTLLLAVGAWEGGRRPGMVLGGVFACIWLLLLWILGRQKQETGEKVCPQGAQSASDEECMRLYAERFCFTSREKEVFRRLVLTEAGVQEMAEGLFMSRRSLQRHIASIYEKTGTKSRVGLVRSYFLTLLSASSSTDISGTAKRSEDT